MIEHLKEERRFLHDISSPLMVALGMVDAVVSHIKVAPNIDPILVSKLEKATAAMGLMTGQIRERREKLSQTST